VPDAVRIVRRNGESILAGQSSHQKANASSIVAPARHGPELQLFELRVGAVHVETDARADMMPITGSATSSRKRTATLTSARSPLRQTMVGLPLSPMVSTRKISARPSPRRTRVSAAP